MDDSTTDSSHDSHLKQHVSIMDDSTTDSSHLLSRLEDILDSDPQIDEVGFIHPMQFTALAKEVRSSPSSSSRGGPQLEDKITKPKPVRDGSYDAFFWHRREHKLGISTFVLFPLYLAARNTFMDAYRRYVMLNESQLKTDAIQQQHYPNASCVTSLLDVVESEVMKHSRALLLLSCDFGTAWNSSIIREYFEVLS
ncbi:hypothetical protein OROGR_027647 [Orobanche gracilis]